MSISQCPFSGPEHDFVPLPKPKPHSHGHRYTVCRKCGEYR